MHRLAQEMAQLNYSHLDVFSVRYSVAEAIKNAIVHAHKGDPHKIVHLSYLIAPDYVLAEVIDEGPGFDPRSVPNPMAPENRTRDLGKGLYFMRLFMTWIRHDGRGNRVTLCKIRMGAYRAAYRADGTDIDKGSK